MAQNKVMHTTEILVVGGGFGGLVCGTKAAEEGAEVLIVDKAIAGGGGGASRAGNGIIVIPNDEESVEKYVEYHVRNIGAYLNDQDMIRQIAYSMYDTLMQLIKWGVKVTTDKGGVGMFPVAGNAPWKMTGIEMNCNLSLRRAANKAGVSFLDHVQITGLLTDGDHIAGAVGYDLYDGTFHVIQAKAVVLSTGACHYKNVSMFVGCGEGNKLAFEAGAKMRNAEFGNSYEVYAVDKGNTIYGSYPFVHNSKGENIWDKYVTWKAPGPTADFWRGFVQEYRDGNYPLYIDMKEFHDTLAVDEEWRFMGQCFMEGPKEGTEMVRMFPDKLKFAAAFEEREAEYVHMTDKPEVKVAMHGNSGFVDVGLDFQTNVKGLFAIGIDSWNGSSTGGAVGHPGMQKGNGLGHAGFSAYICAPHAVKVAKESEMPTICEAQIDAFEKVAFAHMEVADGYDPHEMIAEVQGCITPVKYNCVREDALLQEAIDKLVDVRMNKLPKMQAKDFHENKLCLEVEAMAMTGEMMMRSALLRKESRGTHIHAQYKEKDNENWLKWIYVENDNGEMKITTKDIPIETYKYRPDNAY